MHSRRVGQVTIGLLGGFSASTDGVSVPDGAWRLRKARELVKLLALARGHDAGVAPGDDPKPRAADPRHHALLLEREPLNDLAALERRLREVPAAFCQIPEDRIRLGEDVAVVELEHRGLAQRVQPAELGRQRVAAEDVDGHPLVLRPEQGKEEPYLEAVARRVVVVEAHRRFNGASS